MNLRHHRDDQAFSNCVGFIRGLDKHNMPRLGDVMVPPPQINKVSWFDRKPQAAADEPLYRFYQGTRATAAVPSSNVEGFQQSGVGRARLRARQFWGRCSSSTVYVAAWAARWNIGHHFLSPFLTVPLVEFTRQSRRLWMLSQFWPVVLDSGYIFFISF